MTLTVICIIGIVSYSAAGLLEWLLSSGRIERWLR